MHGAPPTRHPSSSKSGDTAPPDFSLVRLRRQDLQALRLPRQEGRGRRLVPEAMTRGCTIECKSLAENGHLLKDYQVTYFMASVDPLEDN